MVIDTLKCFIVTQYASKINPVKLRGCSHDTRMSFIPEWVSFQNEVRTTFTWQNRPTQPSWKRPFYLPSWKRYACATRPRLRGLRFHHGTEFVFSLHDTRMKCHTRTRVSFGLKTGMKSFRNDLCGTQLSSRYHVNRYREIYGDGMTSFWNERPSGIMWTAPYSHVWRNRYRVYESIKT